MYIYVRIFESKYVNIRPSAGSPSARPATAPQRHINGVASKKQYIYIYIYI